MLQPCRWGGRPIGRSRKLILWIAGLTTAALCGLLLWGAGILNVPTRHVAMPPANASPEEVVRVYLAAQNAGDVDTMNAMVVDDHMRHSRSAGRWVVTDIDIWPAMAEGLQGTRAEGGRKLYTSMSALHPAGSGHRLFNRV